MSERDRRNRVADALGVNRSHEDVTAVLEAVADVHPMKCPACEETLRATNVEWLFQSGSTDTGDVIPSQFLAFSEYSRTDDKEQLYYCPNNDCGVARLDVKE